MTAPPKPALTPPPGVIPDFDDPFSLLPYVNLTIAGGIFITTVLTAARLYVKARIVKKFLWEDWTAFAGYVSNHTFELYYSSKPTRAPLYFYLFATPYSKMAPVKILVSILTSGGSLLRLVVRGL